jgi:hypothetical protein
MIHYSFFIFHSFGPTPSPWPAPRLPRPSVGGGALDAPLPRPSVGGGALDAPLPRPSVGEGLSALYGYAPPASPVPRRGG